MNSIAPVESKICAYAACKKEGASQLCGRCFQVNYCNRECQLSAWKADHKASCIHYMKPDALGLSRVHYAVLSGKEDAIPQNVLDRAQEIQFPFNGTLQDVRQLMALPAREGPISLQYQENGHAPKAQTQPEFSARNDGVLFKDGFVIRGENLLKMYRKHPGIPPNAITIDREDPRIKHFEESPPLVFQAEENKSVGNGLCAGQKIKKDEISCLLGGEEGGVEPHTRKAQFYNFAGSDQTKFCGKGALINHGPPNCRRIGILNYKGMPLVTVIVAIRDIEEGEFLHFDYAFNHSLLSKRYYLSPEAYAEAKRFCQQGHFALTKELAASMTQNKEPYLAEMFKYIFSVASLFVRLHVDSTLREKDTAKMIAAPHVQELFSDTFFFKHYSNLLQITQKIKETKDKELIEQISFLADHITQGGFVQALLAMGESKEFSAKTFKNYQLFGTILDQLDCFGEGVLTSNYTPVADRSAESKEEKADLESMGIVKQYKTLPPFLQKKIKDRIQQSYIPALRQRGSRDKEKALIDLEKKL